MLRTLFVIPNEIAGFPVFGVGLVLLLWLVACSVFLFFSGRKHGWGKSLAAELPVFLLGGIIIAFITPQVATETGLAVRGYGLMVAAGVLSGWGLLTRGFKKEGWDTELVVPLVLYLFIPAMICTRLFYVVEFWNDSFAQILAERGWLACLGSILNATSGGLVVYGAFLGGALGLVIFARRHKLSFLRISDLLAPCLMIGLAFGRLGCFCFGCCYGGLADVGPTIQFPADSPAYEHQLSTGVFHGFRLPIDGDDEPVILEVLPCSHGEGCNTDLHKKGVTKGTRITHIAIGNSRALPVSTVKKVRQLFIEQVRFIKFDSQGRPVPPPPEIKTTEISNPDGSRAWYYDQGRFPITLTVKNPDGKTATLTLPPQKFQATTLPIYPTQLYSSTLALLICLLLLWFQPHRRHAGQTLALLMLTYPIARFGLEILRSDEPPIWGTGMTISQNISILLFCVGLYLFFRKGKKLTKEEGEEGGVEEVEEVKNEASP